MFYRLALAIIFLIGAILRLQGIAERPLWLDEGIQWQLATVSDWLSYARQQDLHPPLYAFLNRLYFTTSSAPWTVRLPAIFAGLAAIPAAFWCGVRWDSRRLGLCFATLYAFHPAFIAYSGEARPYSLTILWLTLLLGTLSPGASATSRWSQLLSVLAICSQVSAWPVVIWANLCTSSPARRLRDTATSLLTCGALYVGLISHQLTHQGAGLETGHLASHFWTLGSVSPETVIRWVSTLGYLLIGQGQRSVAIVGVALLALSSTRLWRQGLDRRATLAFAPLISFLILSGMGLHPMAPSRHLLACAPAFLLWLVLTTPPAKLRLGMLAALGLQFWALSRPLLRPYHDLPDVLVQVSEDDSPLWVDASLVPQFDAYGTANQRQSAVRLPWRSHTPLSAAVESLSPPERFVFLYADFRREEVAVMRTNLSSRWTLTHTFASAGVIGEVWTLRETPH